MAVIADTLAKQWAGSTGSVNRDEGAQVEYMAIWHVQVDNGLDQAQNILVWFQLNVAPLGSPYVYANDTLGSLATCHSIRAVRKPETTDWWNIEVHYNREDDDAKRTIDDQPAVLSPLEYRPVIRCSSNAVTKPATKLRYLHGYSPRISAKIGVGVPTIPVSSNMKPLDPLPEVDGFHWYVSIEQNLETFDGNLSFVGFTNGETFSINYKGFTRGPIQPAQAKIRDCEVEFMGEHTVDFWKVRYYVEILPDGEDFLHTFPDIGMDSIACCTPRTPIRPDSGCGDAKGGGDPDLHGGSFGQNPAVDTPIAAGRAHSVGLIDVHGMPIRAPALLDGDGHALDVCVEPVVPVISTWWEGKEVTFTKVPVIKEILV